MKQSEAVACRQKFKCPQGGCGIHQRFLSLARHLTLFHKWPHATVDEWRDKLTLADVEDQINDRKRHSEGSREKKISPPPPKAKQLPEKHGVFNNGGTCFTLGDIVRFA